MREIILKLQEHFGLDEKHSLILNVLIDNNKISAKDICKETSIAVGRIYDYLNFLIDSGLIKRSLKRPYVYYIDNLNESIINYTKTKLDTMLDSQYDLIESMSKTSPEHFDRFTSSKKFTQIHLSMISEAKKTMKYISLHTACPYVLYPEDKDNFIKLRKAIVESRPTITYFDPMVTILIYKTYFTALNQGKEFIIIMEKKSFYDHLLVIKKLGVVFFNYWKKSIIEQFNKYSIKLYIIDEYLPFQIDINEKRVNVSFRHFEIINGIVIYGENITGLYNQVFEQHINRSKDVLPIIKKLKFN
jgi:predicted transcriptional regulator